jgi:isocitrate dehydrogenase (NAD+)
VTYPVVLIPGDGIGPEVTAAARRVLEATGVPIDWIVHEVGIPALDAGQDALPAAVLADIRATRTALKGPVSTPTGATFRSVNLSLRRELDLYLQVRPCRSWPGADRRQAVDVIVMRECTEDLYAGVELAPGEELTRTVAELLRTSGHHIATDAGLSLKPISASATRRAARLASSYAQARGRRRMTVVHKASVLRATDGNFLRVALAEGHSCGLLVDDLLVDTAAAELATQPETFDVIFTTNMYGDILSDLAAAVTGGVGLGAGVNLGDDIALFEPAHGTAPRHAGAGRANPVGAILSGALLLRHVGEEPAASAVERAVATAIANRQVTYDLTPGRTGDGALSTSGCADAIIARLS